MSHARSLWHLLNLPCEGMARLASESLDRELGPMERLALRLHLLYCAACRRYSRQLKLLQGALWRLGASLQTDDPLPGAGLPDDTRERIKRSLKSE
jgi:predicted anti-sigma-YlaC factor YlaD